MVDGVSQGLLLEEIEENMWLPVAVSMAWLNQF
jgi:hypothetical protein